MCMFSLFNSYFHYVCPFRIKKQGKKHLPTVLHTAMAIKVVITWSVQLSKQDILKPAITLCNYRNKQVSYSFIPVLRQCIGSWQVNKITPSPQKNSKNWLKVEKQGFKRTVFPIKKYFNCTFIAKSLVTEASQEETSPSPFEINNRFS